MDVNEQIQTYFSQQPQKKRDDLQRLDTLVRELLPKARLWFLDGRDETGKVVSNPNVGYGLQILTYADGKTKEFYQIGISANTSGIPVYILGLKDKNFLVENFGKELGKASVTGYCIKFKSLADVKQDVLAAAIRKGAEMTSTTVGARPR